MQGLNEKNIFFGLLFLFFLTGNIFAAIPLINSITPNSGYSYTTTAITITGSNFDSTCKVYIEAGRPYLKGSINTPGKAKGIFIYGNYAYVADDTTGLQVIDISNPASPSIKGSINIPGEANEVFVSGNYAYVADGLSGLQIIDITNPASPTIVGVILTSGYANGIYVSGNYAYLSNGDSGLQIIDVTQPNNPSIVENVSTSGYAEGVYISGNYVYIADGTAGLQIIDINNPSIVGSIDTPKYAKGVYVQGNYAYVADGETGLQVISLYNPKDPKLVGSVDIHGYANAVYISRNYAYVTDENLGMQIIDIRNPINPVLVDSLDTPGKANGVYIFGNYAYVADGYSGLEVIDISNPTNPSKLGNINTPGTEREVQVSGNYAYIAGWSTALEVIDISNPASPQMIKTVGPTINAFGGLYISGSYLFATNWEFGFNIINISNPANSNIVGSLQLNGASNGIYVKGNYSYVATGQALEIINITNPSSPQIVGSLVMPYYSSEVFVLGNYAYVATGSGCSLEIVNITNPSSPQRVSHVTIPYGNTNWASGVYALGNYAYLATGDLGLQIIDVSNPVNPSIVKTVDTPGSAFKVYINGNYAYVADYLSGVQIIDITNPISPVIVSTIDDIGGVAEVHVSDNYICAVSKELGLQIVDKLSAGTTCKLLGNITGDKITVEVPKGLLTGRYNIKIVNSQKNETVMLNGFRIKSSDQVPSVSLGVSDTEGKSSFSVKFVATAYDNGGSIVKYDWDFDGNANYDTTTYTGIIDNIYSSTGIYNAKVKVTDNDGDEAFASVNINVLPLNILPSVSLVANKNSGKPPLIVDFTAVAADSDGMIVSYSWDFDGDNVYDTTTISNKVSCIYNSTGSYWSKVRVTDDDNAQTISSPKIISVDGIGPLTVITNPVNEKTVSGIIIIDATISDMPPVNSNVSEAVYFFDSAGPFPLNAIDGNFDSSVENVMAELKTNSFTNGLHTIAVKGKDVFGNWGSIATVNIDINNVPANNPPSVIFKDKSYYGNAPFLVDFTVNASDSDGNIISYDWDFDGNGSYDTVTVTNIVSYIYFISGSYNAKVRVTDNNGAQAEVSVVITVKGDSSQLEGNIDTSSTGSLNRIDGHDLYVLSKAFGSNPQSLNWNPTADLDGNNIVDGNDLVILAGNFGKRN